MDRLDFQLLRALHRDPLASHTSLAHTIGRSTGTVRRRLQSLMERKILRGFITVPAAEPLGVQSVGGKWTATVPAEALFAIEGTFGVGNTIDGNFFAVGFSGSAQAWLEAVNRLAGAAPIFADSFDRYNGPALGPLDLRVLRALVEAPRGSATELAALSGLSAQTVRNRRDALVKNKAVVIWPLIQPAHSGAIFYHLHVTCGRRQRRAVQEILVDAIGGDDPGDMLCFFCLADDLEQQARRLAALRALGIQEIEVVQDDDWVFRGDVVLRVIDRALDRWKEASGAGGSRSYTGSDSPTPSPVGIH